MLKADHLTGKSAAEDFGDFLKAEISIMWEISVINIVISLLTFGAFSIAMLL